MLMRHHLGSVVLFSLGAAVSCGSEQDQQAASGALPAFAEQERSGAPAPSVAAERIDPEGTAVEASPPPSVQDMASDSEARPTVLAPMAAPSNEGPAAPPAAMAPAEAPAETPPAPPPEGPRVGPEPNPALLAACTGTDPIACHFGGAPGNYFVTVVLGGDVAASTRVLAETRRSLLAPVVTAAGETRRLTFGVNVRQPEGEPIQAVPAGTPGLDLYFHGSNGAPPALSGIGTARATAPFMIYVAGDSTVADQTGVDYGGWAQQLPQYFDYPVTVANYSDSGESSGSFLAARPLFGTVEAQLAPNDYVLIQFGHNDKTVTAAQFHDNMTSLVTRVKAKGAFPVLFSPVARAQFNGASVAVQHVNSTGADLPAIVAQVAREQSVPFLDLTARTSAWLAELGPRGWQPFHALGTDVTHTNDAGAAVEAGFVRDLIVGARLTSLTSHLR